MEKITLQPGVWTRLWGTVFQVVGQNDIRITVGTDNAENTDGVSVLIPATDAAYFTTQGYNPKVISIADFGFDQVGAYIYLMPDHDVAVGIVAL